VDRHSGCQQGVILHTVFDLLAAMASAGVTAACYRWRLDAAGARIEAIGMGYALALIIGAVAGGYGAGTLNLWLSGIPEFGRSIVGALAGAITAIEVFKWRRGIRGSTGIIFVPAFAISVVVGRWGCYLSGPEDNTFGTATSLPWGKDFGDGILRHPVQFYESFSMLVFLGVALILLAGRKEFFTRYGFYLMVLFYAGQRFIWEFLKPYGSLIGPFNLFHFVCAGLCIYSVWMMRRGDGRAGS
jgi:phosphatidylglycerol:prolipoprotein diacylglycerol transferase